MRESRFLGLTWLQRMKTIFSTSGVALCRWLWKKRQLSFLAFPSHLSSGHETDCFRIYAVCSLGEFIPMQSSGMYSFDVTGMRCQIIVLRFHQRTPGYINTLPTLLRSILQIVVGPDMSCDVMSWHALSWGTYFCDTFMLGQVLCPYFTLR